MAARTRPAREHARAWHSTDGSVVSALGVAAGYGLAASVLILLTADRMFGPRDTAGRLTVLAMTVGALVIGAAVMRVRRLRQRRRLGGS